jgi:hypothetical protein
VEFLRRRRCRWPWHPPRPIAMLPPFIRCKLRSHTYIARAVLHTSQPRDDRRCVLHGQKERQLRDSLSSSAGVCLGWMLSRPCMEGRTAMAAARLAAVLVVGSFHHPGNMSHGGVPLVVLRRHREAAVRPCPPYHGIHFCRDTESPW